MSRDSILDDAIAKAKADGDVELAEWLRITRGAEKAVRWYTTMVKELEDFARRVEECAKKREPVTLFGVDYVAEEELEFERIENSWAKEFLGRIGPKCGTPDCTSLVAYVNGLQAENAELRKLVEGLWYCTEQENRAQCERCPLGEVEGDRLALACEKTMRELGIEVG